MSVHPTQLEEKDFYLTKPDGSQEGPYTYIALKERYDYGKYPEGTVVWYEGSENWLPIEQVFGTVNQPEPPYAPSMPSEQANAESSSSTKSKRHINWIKIGLPIFLIVLAGSFLWLYDSESSEQQPSVTKRTHSKAHRGKKKKKAKKRETDVPCEAPVVIQDEISPKHLASFHHEDCKWHRVSSDVRLLATVSDHCIRLWNVETGQQIGTDILNTENGDAKFTPDARKLVTWGKAICIWDTATGKLIREIPRAESPSEIILSPDGHRLVDAHSDLVDECPEGFCDARAGVEIDHDRCIRERGGVVIWTYSSYGTEIPQTWSISTYRVWDIETGKQIGHDMTYVFTDNSVVFSPDGNKLAISAKQYVYIRDVRTGRQLSNALYHEANVKEMLFSQDGVKLAVSTHERSCSLWNAETGQKIGTTTHRNSSPNLICFTGDGTKLCTQESAYMDNWTFTDNAVRLWDTKTAQPTGRMIWHQSEIVRVRFSADYRLVAIVDKQGGIHIWNVQTGEKEHQVNSPINDIYSLTFHPDATKLALLGKHSIAFLDIKSGMPIGKNLEVTEALYNVTFTPDGKKFLFRIKDDVQLFETPTTIIQSTPLAAEMSSDKKGEGNIAALKKRANRGDVAAQQALAQCYENGDGVPPDAQEAEKWYRKAAEQGDAESQQWLAIYYTNKKDYSQALLWRHKAAENGHAGAQMALYVHYISGSGLPAPDAEIALYWLRRSAENGECGAQYALACLYLKSQDTNNAVKWFRKSAEQGFADAQCQLGLYYATGIGVPQDWQKAAYWFGKSAEQGNSWGQYNLATCYLNGQGVGADPKKAVEMMQKSAEQGYDFAQAHLGVLYLEGQVLPENKLKAVYWLKKAAQQGNQDAKQLLSEIQR